MDRNHTTNPSAIVDPSDPTLVAAPSATGADDSSDEEPICSECKEVDWDGLVEQADHIPWTGPSLVLRTKETNHEQLAASSCKICRLLAVVKAQSLDDTECIVGARPLSDFYQAYAVPNTPNWSGRGITALHVCRKDTNYWRDIGSDKCLVVIRRDSQDSSSRMVLPSLVNYDWVKGLAQSCEESHERCRPSSLGAVPGLKVIEASSRTITEAPAECRYVALSYVWGKEPDSTQIVASQLQNTSPLIKDALSVTTAMGYKYLWVDKYCISQTDEQEKRHMINQMGQVYENASLTIIKASEGDTSAQSGLPGVSSPTRRSQRYAHIHNTTILELPSGEHELKSSKWATRGWTYQEGYLSRRRLIFTPSQIIFLCRENYAEESVVQLLQEVVTSDNMWKFKHLIGSVDTFGVEEDHAGKLLEYSKRHLSDPKDSLNAFLGVLNFDIDNSRRTYSPILHLSCGIVAHGLDPDNEANDELGLDLNWYHETPAERRHELPTWSWAGWGGALKIDKGPTFNGLKLYRPGKSRRILRQFEWEISWQSRVNNKPVSIWELVDEYCSTSYNTDYKLQLHQQPDYPKRLEVTCFVVPVHFEVISLKKREMNGKTEVLFEDFMNSAKVGRRGLPTGSVPVLHFMEGVRVATTAYMDQDIDHKDGIIGLLFEEEGSYTTFFGCILAQQSPGASKGVYERVGAIPRLFYYDRVEYHHEFPPVAFLDEKNSILKEVKVSAGQRESLFSCVGGRRTISLV